MAQADGTILIDTEINADGMKAGSKEVEKNLKYVASVIEEETSHIKDLHNSALNFINDYVDNLDNASKSNNKFKNDIETLKKELKSLEDSGQFFGDDAYDETYLKLKEATDALKNYKKSLDDSTYEENPFGLDTYAGKIREAEIELNNLAQAGKGLGDADYDEAYRNLALLLKEAKEYRKELTKTTEIVPAPSLDTYEGKIQQLENRLNALKQAGKGLGDADYDSAYRDLALLKKEAKEYRKELEKTTEIVPSANLDTYEGKIQYLQNQLDFLKQAGKGLGDADYDTVYRWLQLIKAEARDYAKELSKTPEQFEKEQEKIDALNQKLAETEAKEARAVAEALKLRAIGDMAEISNQDIVDLNNELTKLKARQAELDKAGLGTGYKEYDENISRIAQIESELRNYSNTLKVTKKDEDKLNTSNNKLTKSNNKVAKSLNRTGKSANNAGMSMGRMLASSILFSTVFSAISLVTSGIGEGIQNLAQYSNEFNQNMSMLMSALTRLKNAFATAFAPILDVVAPILTRFINLLADAITYVGMFFAALSGKDTFVRAKKVQQDYADSLKDTADSTKEAAKEAEKYLSPLDDINKFTEKNKDSSDSGNSSELSPGDMFETVPIDNKFSNLLDSVSDKLKQIRDIFMAGFWDGLGDYKPLLKELKMDLSSIGKYLTDIFTDADVQAAAKRFAKSFIYNLGKIAGSFAKIGLTIAVNIVGGIESYLSENVDRIKKYLINMFDIGTEIFDLFGTLAATIAEIFSSVFGSQVAQDLTGNIIGIFAEAFMGVTSLAAALGRDLLGLIVTPLVENKEKIKTALLETIAPLEQITQSIETFIQNVVDKVTILYNEHIKPFIDSLASGISSIVGTLLDAYNSYIAPILDKWADKFDEVLKGPVSDAVNSLLTVIGKLFDALKTLWENVLVPLINWIIQNIVPVIAPIIGQMGTAALSLLGTVADVVSGILDALGGLIDFIVGVFTGNWSQAFDGLKTIADGFKKSFNATFKFIKENILNPFDKFLEDVFSTDWEKNFGVLGGVLEGFFTSVKSIWNGIKGVFDGIITFINGVFSGDWKKAWNGIKKIFKGVFDSLVGIVKTPINAIIGILNGLISGVQTMQNNVAKAINSLSISIPDWVPGVGGSSWSPNLSIWKLSRIPYLASGAVIPPNKEFLAVLGDQNKGNNIEAPESLIRRIVREESGGNSNNTYEVSAKVGRKELFKIIIDEAKMQRTQTGRNPFELA